MSVKIECKVKLNGLDKKLIELGPKLARQTMRKALKTVGNFWVPEVQSRTPVDEGDLKDSIGMRVSTKKAGTIGLLEVGPTFDSKEMKASQHTSQDPGVYGLFVEFGLKAKKYAPHPFMRPTFDATADTALQLFADTLKDDLEDAVKD